MPTSHLIMTTTSISSPSYLSHTPISSHAKVTSPAVSATTRHYSPGSSCTPPQLHARPNLNKQKGCHSNKGALSTPNLKYLSSVVSQTQQQQQNLHFDSGEVKYRVKTTLVPSHNKRKRCRRYSSQQQQQQRRFPSSANLPTETDCNQKSLSPPRTPKKSYLPPLAKSLASPMAIEELPPLISTTTSFEEKAQNYKRSSRKLMSIKMQLDSLLETCTME